jgi:hypothetical protein
MPQKVPPETVALLRRRYAERVPIRSIMAETRIRSIDIFYQCVDGAFDDGSGAPLPLPGLPRRRETLPIVRSSSRRRSLIARIWANAEAQVEKIEARLAEHDFAPKVVERDARALAVLVRTLRELSLFAEMKNIRSKRKDKPESGNDDDAPPRDIDELRNELARRMRAFVEERTGGGLPGGPQG